MQSQDNRPPLIVLIGPTAAGKTALSLNLAMRIDAEIISADSRLFYRGMDIGTAKPNSDERARVAHYLIDFLNPNESFSLGEFQKSVYTLADDILRRGKLPMLVGGTGQYVRAITEGWVIPEQEPDPTMRGTLDNLAANIGTEGLHRWLQILDPAAAAVIDHRNARRTVRALEVIFSTGVRFSEQRTKRLPRYRSWIIGLSRTRADLYERIDARIEAMLSQGFVAEVASLLSDGYSPNLPAMTAIGYQEISRHLRGEISLEEAVRLMKKRTRTFVRRQANWFKSDDPAIRWFDANDLLPERVHEYLAVAIHNRP